MKCLVPLLLFLLVVSCSVNRTNQEQIAVETMSHVDSIAFQLFEIWALDQGIRNRDVFDAKSKVVAAVDSLCFVKSVDFIKKNGWPTKRMLGKYSNYEAVDGALFPVMLHEPRRMNELEIHEMLINEVKDGHLSAQACALFFDKYWVVCHKKSMYNTAFKAWTKSRGVLLSDRQVSDSLMREIGLDVLPDSVFIKE